jgi:hypothetical protein
MVGVGIDVLRDACNPVAESPFLTLNEQCWAALKRNTGSRGSVSVAPIALGLTLLELWFRHSQPRRLPTVGDAHTVLETIHLRDQNATRGIRTCSWLRQSGYNVMIKPERIDSAIELVRAYCTRRPPAFSLFDRRGRRVKDDSEYAAAPAERDNETTDKPKRTTKARRSATTVVLEKLFGEGYFSRERAVREILAYAKHTLSRPVDRSCVSTTLARWTDYGRLSRRFIEDRNHSRYVYRAAGTPEQVEAA